MPTAICTGCGALLPWRNRRGSSIRDLRCCGVIRKAVWTPGGYLAEESRVGKGLGRKAVRCAYCGRTRMTPGGVLWRPPVAVRLSPYRDGRSAKCFEAGTDLCHGHWRDLVGECTEYVDCEEYGYHREGDPLCAPH